MFSRPPSDIKEYLEIYDNKIVRGLWPAVTIAEWNDPQWQLRNRLKTVNDLNRIFHLNPDDTNKYIKIIKQFHYSITPYYLSLADALDLNDPIVKQSVPDFREDTPENNGESDPLSEEDDTIAKGLIQRYPDRALVVATNFCAMYCRHCTRKRKWVNGKTFLSKEELTSIVEEISFNKNIREIILSGGDPLMLEIDHLDYILTSLHSIPHVEVIRIGTRVPVVLPMLVTDKLVQVLKKFRPLWLNTQFNHPNEVTHWSAEACDKILCGGIPVSNQSVLLKGVNDTIPVMKLLLHKLQRIMVRPYYLFQCDNVSGAEHFKTTVQTGVDMIANLRGHTSGLCVPTYVIDAPHGGGKIPIQPDYIRKISRNSIIMENYEGKVYEYYNPR
jgi:lysine 2,3-aminomutase